MELLHFVPPHLSHSALPWEHTKREELRKNVFFFISTNTLEDIKVPPHNHSPPIFHIASLTIQGYWFSWINKNSFIFLNIHRFTNTCVSFPLITRNMLNLESLPFSIPHVHAIKVKPDWSTRSLRSCPLSFAIKSQHKTPKASYYGTLISIRFRCLDPWFYGII